MWAQKFWAMKFQLRGMPISSEGKSKGKGKGKDKVCVLN
jgi:hypothetical protein